MCVVQGIVSCLGAQPKCFSLVYQEVSCSPLSSTLALNLLASTRSGGEVDQYSQMSFDVSSKASSSISRMLFAFHFLIFFTDELLVLVAFLLGAVTGSYLICSAVTLDRDVIRGESARPVAIMTAAVMPPITATRVNTNILARRPQEAARGTGDRCEVRFAIQGRRLYHVKQR